MSRLLLFVINAPYPLVAAVTCSAQKTLRLRSVVPSTAPKGWYILSDSVSLTVISGVETKVGARGLLTC